MESTATENPLSDVGPDLQPSGRAAPPPQIEDVGPDLQPSGRLSWRWEREQFDAYLKARGIVGFGDTAGTRLQRTQVRQMEKSLAEAGLDAQQVLKQALGDEGNSAITEAWQIEADEEFGCPMGMALWQNTGCIFLLVGAFLGASFWAAYNSTPHISDAELERQAIARYRDAMAEEKRRQANDLYPEPEPEPEPDAGSAYVFFGLSMAMLALSVLALLSGRGGKTPPAETAPEAGMAQAGGAPQARKQAAMLAARRQPPSQQAAVTGAAAPAAGSAAEPSKPDLSDAADFLRARRAPADAPQAEQGQEAIV